MPSLAETQGLFREAVAGGTTEALLPLLRVPAERLERLEIYRRHHRESFRRHLRGRYPTVEWLIGTDAMVGLADALVREQPPRTPSLAEFGGGLAGLIVLEPGSFPAWLADVARLDWHLGELSVATEHAALGLEALAASAPHSLPEARLRLQPGLVYLHSAWPVDTLVHLRLGGGAPERLDFAPHDSWLELRGARGRFSITRLAPGDHAFRQALAAAAPLGEAAQRGLDAAGDFDLAASLAGLFAAGLVIAAIPSEETSDV